MNSTDQFETIVRQYYEPLYRFARSLTRAEFDAEDLTQQTFFIWATKGHQLRDVSKVKTWLFTTLHRTFLAKCRTQMPVAHVESAEVREHLATLSVEISEQLDYSQVLPALAQVDAIYQTAMTLYYLRGRSYRDIAAELSIPMGTVKSRIARGLAQLKEILLMAGYRDSSLNRDEIFTIASTVPTAPLPEREIHARCCRELAEAELKAWREEWGFSPVSIEQQLGAA